MIVNERFFESFIPHTEILGGGYVILDESWRHEGCCDSFSRLYYVTSGSGFLKYRDKSVAMQPGNVYLVPAMLTFSYGCHYLEKLFFHVSVIKNDRYDLLSGQSDIYSMPFPIKETERLRKLCASNDCMSYLSMKAAVYKTISDFSESFNFKKIAVKDYSKAVKKAISYIHNNIRISLSVKEISAGIFVSESSIRNRFKDEVGVTIGQYVDDAVLFEAKKLLRAEGMPIKEISEQLGFCDQFYFSRRFKEKFGQTPTQYRKEIII